MTEYSADGKAVTPENTIQPDALASQEATFALLALSAVVPSLTNPRKTLDPVKLQELADTIKVSGVHTPVLVRPLPAHRVPDTDRKVTHELVAGERRYRASLLAGVATLPAMVHQLTDGQALEIQIIENLQREDISALEEAEGYAQLVEATGCSKEDIAAKIGKSRRYVYGRFSLMGLAEASKQAYRDGAIDTTRAHLLATVPDSKLQATALDFALTKTGYLQDTPSVRELQNWMRSNVMLHLNHAPFQITDANLWPGAGSCKTCPKRTGADRDLFAHVNDADVCTDPPCYHAKAKMHSEILREKAKSVGMEIIDGKQAKKAMPHQYMRLQGYSKTTQKIGRAHV